MNYPNPNNTIVTVCLDQSGSMARLKADTLGGLNGYIGKLRELPGEVAFTLIMFDGLPNGVRLKKHYLRTPIAQVRDLVDADYVPEGVTPLYDAAMAAIAETEVMARINPGAKVVVVLQTDGEENASREHGKLDLRREIERRQGQGWEFVFMGTGIDAYGEAGSLGIKVENTLRYAGDRTELAFAAMGMATRNYAGGMAATMAIAPEDKLKAGDPAGAA